MGGKVAKIDFFRVGIHAKNGHLSTDKVTKFSDKWFVLKKTSTGFVPVPPKIVPILLPNLSFQSSVEMGF